MTAQRLSAGPGLHLESPYINDGLVVAGVDEVGKGSWAGPLVVGVAVLGSKVVNGEFPDGMRDSKALTERVRERVFDGIGAACSSWSTGWASAQECDELGMSEAQRLACERAFGSLGVSVDVAIVDGRWDFVSPLVDEIVMQVKADRECASVAAASVLAKVSRDR
ncbi:MAG: ribonuclease HII, partial [Ilumatobacteraceae bacterium]